MKIIGQKRKTKWEKKNALKSSNSKMTSDVRLLVSVPLCSVSLFRLGNDLVRSRSRRYNDINCYHRRNIISSLSQNNNNNKNNWLNQNIKKGKNNDTC